MNEKILKTYESIQKKIIQEEFYPGQKITETMLINEFVCSRDIIRKVISLCEANNIFEVRAKSGTYVKRETAKSFRDKVEVRTYLEKLACRLLIENISSEDLNKLYKLVACMDKELEKIPYSPQAFSDIHYTFHYSMVKMSKNECLLRSFENLNFRYSYLFAEGSAVDIRIVIRSNKEHKELLDFIKSKDLENTESTIEKHLWYHKAIPASLKELTR